jgi:hypothetical protein
MQKYVFGDHGQTIQAEEGESGPYGQYAFSPACGPKNPSKIPLILKDLQARFSVGSFIGSIQVLPEGFLRGSEGGSLQRL